MKIILFVIFTLGVEVLFGQTAIYKWNTESCTFESKYNTKLYSEIQINNCYKLFYLNEFNFQKTPRIFKYEDLKNVYMDTIDHEYQVKKNLLLSLDLPKTPFWEEVRKCKLIEVEQLYKLSRIMVLSFTDPKYLRQFEKTDSCTLQHANALIAGGDSLLSDWYKLTIKLAGNNGRPEKVWSDYYMQLSSKEKFNYARIDVGVFGWWNCAACLIDRTEVKFNSDLQMSMFLKLFIKTKTIECIEP